MFHQVVDIVVQYVVVPSSGMLRSLPPDQAKHGTTTVFRNGTGILRNVSAASPETRKLLRVAPNMIEALLFFLRTSIQRNQIDNRAVENVVCLLRNLNYRLVLIIFALIITHFKCTRSCWSALRPSCYTSFCSWEKQICTVVQSQKQKEEWSVQEEQKRRIADDERRKSDRPEFVMA